MKTRRYAAPAVKGLIHYYSSKYINLNFTLQQQHINQMANLFHCLTL